MSPPACFSLPCLPRACWAPVVRATAGCLLAGASLALQAAPIGASLEPPAPRAEPNQGAQVLERALSGDVGAAGRQSNLSLEMRRGDNPAGIARAEPAAASAVRLPLPTRIAPAAAPAPATATAQVPSLLHGQLAATSNEVVARPEAPKLARDWTPGGTSTGGGVAAAQGYGGPPGEAGAAPGRSTATSSGALAPLAWLSQGLAYIRENRMALLAGVGALALALAVQQARARRRRA